MLDILSIDLLGVIPEDEYIVVAGNRGELAAVHLTSQAGQAYRNIARRLLGEEVPLMPLDQTNGLFKRLARIFKNP